jgi:hypothetical protein
MHPISFREANANFGASQPEYLPLPAHKAENAQGTIVTCWQLDTADIDQILKTKCIWHICQTFNHPLQPVKLTTERPFVSLKSEDGGSDGPDSGFNDPTKKSDYDMGTHG